MSDRPAGAMFAAMDLPAEAFRNSRTRLLDKLVLLAIARSANPDGTGAYPSLQTLGARSLVTDRAVRKSILRLTQMGLLRVESKAGCSGKLRGRTNLYQVVIPPHAEIDVPHVDDDTRNVAHDMRNDGARHPERCTPHPEVSVPTTVLRPGIINNRTTTGAAADSVANSLCEELGISGKKNVADIVEALGLWSRKLGEDRRTVASMMLTAWGAHREKPGFRYDLPTAYFQAGSWMDDYRFARFMGKAKTVASATERKSFHIRCPQCGVTIDEGETTCPTEQCAYHGVPIDWESTRAECTA